MENENKLQIAVLVFNPIQENTILLWDHTRECVVVDAGNFSAAEDARLTQFIASKGLKPVLALNTHGHFDHVMGVEYLRRTYDIPFALHSDDQFLLEHAGPSATLFGVEPGALPASADIDLKGMDEIAFGETRLRIIPTPGHTPGHVCFFQPENRILLTGDTLFCESIGRTDLPGGDYSWIMRSILDQLLPLGDDVHFWPGHGPDSTIGHETLYNPFITEILNNEVNFR